MPRKNFWKNTKPKEKQFLKKIDSKKKDSWKSKSIEKKSRRKFKKSSGYKPSNALKDKWNSGRLESMK